MPEESFDPYTQWLGVNSENRPPNHYELLNLEPFEQDSSRISTAVDRQTAILQMVTGNDASLAEKIIAELKQAGECLLNEDAKSEYDAELKIRGELNASSDSFSELDDLMDSPENNPPKDDVNQASASEDESGNTDTAEANDDDGNFGPKSVDSINVDQNNADEFKIDVRKEDERNVSEGDFGAFKINVNKIDNGQADSRQVDKGVGNPGKVDEFKIDVGAIKENTVSEGTVNEFKIDITKSDDSESDAKPTEEDNAEVKPSEEDNAEDTRSEEKKNNDSKADGTEPKIGKGDEGIEDDKAGDEGSKIKVPDVPPVDHEKSSESGPPPTPISIQADDSPDKMSSRIEAQKVKEQQDQNVKIILDRVMWISCGICVIAIAWVMTVRISGCNQDPTVVEKKEDQNDVNDSNINSQRMSPQKKLDRSLISPLEREEKKRLAEEAEKKKDSRENAQKGIGKKGGLNQSDSGFQSIKETITFLDFNQPVNKNDLLSGLAPIRLTKVKWSKNKGNGFLELDKNSRLVVDNEKAFDTLKKFTFLCRFKTSQKNRRQCLISIKGKFVVILDGVKIRYGLRGSEASQTVPNISDNKWHSIALTAGQKTRLWLDGEFVGEVPLALPDFSKTKEQSEIGNHSLSKEHQFVGQIDNLGMYWVELTESQIQSQLAR